MIHLNVHTLPPHSNIVYVGRESFYIDFSTEDNRIEMCVEKLFDLTGSVSFRAELNGLCIDNASEVFYWALDAYKQMPLKQESCNDEMFDRLVGCGFDIVEIKCEFLEL